MNVLITGASGFLGGYIVERFLKDGHVVRAFLRRTSRAERLQKLGVEIVRGDLKDAASLARAVAGMEVVVHAASTMSGPKEEYVAATQEGTLALLSAAEQAGVRRFVHIGSIGVFRARALPKGQQIDEDSPYEDDPELLSMYAASKIASERAALGFAQKGNMQVMVVRPGILYGPRGGWNISRMGYPAGRNRYAIIGMGRNPLPVCYVRNCADAVFLAATRAELTGGTYNIVDDDRVTQREYLRAMKRTARPKMGIWRVPYFMAFPVAWLGERAAGLLKLPCPIRTSHMRGCVTRLSYANDRAKRVLGWRPETPREQALTETMTALAEREKISRRADIRVLGLPVPNAEKVKVCLVGCGVIAETHLQFLNRMDNVTVLALCDVNREAARALGKRYGVVHAYDSLADMLKAETPNAVHILTPPQSHADLTEIAASHGCHVLVEKPMACDAEQARRMVESAERHKVQLCVDHNHLYDPVMVEARRRIESGELGEIIWVDSYYGFDLGNNPRSRYMLPGGEKQWTFHIPGGLYQNIAPHPLSVALDLLGAPSRVEALSRYFHVLPHGPSDELRILLETGRGCGMVTVSLAASPRFQHLNVYGTRGAISVDLLHKWVIPMAQQRGIPKPISRAGINLGHGLRVLTGTVGGMVKLLARKWTPYDGMDLLIREFHSSIQANRPVPVPGRDALAVMEVMDATWRQIGSQAVEDAPV